MGFEIPSRNLSAPLLTGTPHEPTWWELLYQWGGAIAASVARLLKWGA